MMRTGRLFTVYGAPVWASDKSRFLTVACSLQPDARQPHSSTLRRAMALATEAEIPLPCEHGKLLGPLGFPVVDLGDLRATRRPGKKGTEFVVMRGNDGSLEEFGLKDSWLGARPRRRHVINEERMEWRAQLSPCPSRRASAAASS